MAWLRIDDNLPTHPKIAQAGAEASWLWLCGLCYCRRHLTDGMITHAVLPGLSPALKHVGKLATKLVLAGLWDAVEGGYRIHDFHDWNPTRVQVESYRRADRERKKLPDGIQSEPSRASAGDAIYTSVSSSGCDGVSLEESARETKPPDGLGAWFWQEWRRLMAETSQIILPIEPKRAESEQVVRVVDMVPDAARLTAALERFMRLSTDQAKAMNVKAKSVGYFVMALPMLLANPLQEFSAKELADAAEIRRKAFARCPHEPDCSSFDMCVRLIAAERRQKASA